MISTQNLSHFEPVEKRSRFMKSVGYPDLNEFFVEIGVIELGSFSKQMEYDIICQLSLTRSFFPTNFHSNLNPVLEDPYIPISALIYNLEMLGLQLLKCSLVNGLC